jgi:hypothetical protein
MAFAAAPQRAQRRRTPSDSSPAGEGLAAVQLESARDAGDAGEHGERGDVEIGSLVAARRRRWRSTPSGVRPVVSCVKNGTHVKYLDVERLCKADATVRQGCRCDLGSRSSTRCFGDERSPSVRRPASRRSGAACATGRGRPRGAAMGPLTLVLAERWPGARHRRGQLAADAGEAASQPKVDDRVEWRARRSGTDLGRHVSIDGRRWTSS